MGLKIIFYYNYITKRSRYFYVERLRKDARFSQLAYHEKTYQLSNGPHLNFKTKDIHSFFMLTLLIV